MKITISGPVLRNGVPVNEYALDENGNALAFNTVREAINYLADRNWTIADLRDLDFNVEETE